MQKSKFNFPWDVNAKIFQTFLRAATEHVDEDWIEIKPSSREMRSEITPVFRRPPGRNSVIGRSTSETEIRFGTDGTEKHILVMINRNKLVELLKIILLYAEESPTWMLAAVH